jgi:lipopolysaccharide export system protein LptA
MKRKFWIGLVMVMLAKNAFALGLSDDQRDNSQPVEITADSLEVQQEKHVAVFTGSVEAVQGEIVLRSDQMIVHYRQKKEGEQNGVSKIETQGNVFLATPKESAQGENGIYDVDRHTITLSGNVMVSSGKNVVKGTDLVYNLKTGESRIVSQSADGEVVGGNKGRVRGVFIPEGVE